MSKPLSPAPQAVINAIAKQVLADGRINLEHLAASALRALEEQLAQDKPGPMSRDLEIAVLTERIRMLRKITDIATELEAER